MDVAAGRLADLRCKAVGERPRTALDLVNSHRRDPVAHELLIPLVTTAKACMFSMRTNRSRDDISAETDF